MNHEEKQNRSSDRRRVLISAYACGPQSGPEAVAGWDMAVAAAATHDVWVITRPRFREAIEAALAQDSVLREHLHVEYYDPPARVVRLKRRGWDLYWFYLVWQHGVADVARQLHGQVAFDVVHHATFANDWMPAGVTAVTGVPMVWGPVGGSSRLPVLTLSRWLGVRGTATELFRTLTTGPLRSIGGKPSARRARLVVAQNPQVARYFARVGARTVVEPNATLAELPPRSETPREKNAVFAGRLLAWKGAALAIDTIAQPELADWTLDIYGTGYERRRLEKLARKLGVNDRVAFHGHVQRDELLDAIARATVFLFPSMHDQAGWVVAEASSIGCPVVCLPLGGPPFLAQPNGYVASLHGNVAHNLALQVLSAEENGATPTDRWSSDRLAATVSGWYDEATAVSRESVEAPEVTRVLESFSTPKTTTNPYITQLHRALQNHPGINMDTFSYRSALLRRHDVVHVHWPELLMGGHKRVGRVARRALTAATLAKWTVTRTPIVRTLHNLDRPTNIGRVDHLLLNWIDALTTHDIHLNAHTPGRERIERTVIPHGHYRDWFSEFTQEAPAPGRVGYVGLIRRYKGVETLIEAFTELQGDAWSLHVAGNPSTPQLADALRELARGDDRIDFDLRYLSEADFVAAITAAELIVLPYRHMHNSGTALAVLSLSRKVLLPDNEVNRALQGEVGDGWVHVYTGDVTADDLSRALASPTPPDVPDLSGREWRIAGDQHRSVFSSARTAKGDDDRTRRGPILT